MTVAASRGSTGSRPPSSYSRAVSTRLSGSGTGGIGIFMLFGGSQLGEDLDLDRGVQREGRDADRRTGVHSRIAEHLAEQLGRAVGDLRLPGEVGRGRHEDDDLDD